MADKNDLKLWTFIVLRKIGYLNFRHFSPAASGIKQFRHFRYLPPAPHLKQQPLKIMVKF
jgi:hypothetical protein